MILFFLTLLTGCDQIPFLNGGGGGGSDATTTSSGEVEAPKPLVAGGVKEAKEKTGIGALISQGTNSTLPPPVEGITRSQCGDMTDGGPVTDGCVTAELECGQTIVGHTKGGVEVFNTRFYEAHFCTPATTNHNGGGERVYRIIAPEEKGRIYVTLDTPCADLDLAVIRWSGDQCPTISNDVADCEMWPKPGHKREIVDVPNTGGGYFLAVVEGKDDEEGAFALTVQCGPWI